MDGKRGRNRILLCMSVTLLEQPPPTLHRKLGPYRRADHAALPDEPRCELIFGRFYLSPSPVPLHQFLVTRIWRTLDDLAERTGGLALVAPMDVHLADHSVVQPDILYISPARRRILQTWIEGAPDLVVEILSTSTASRDQIHKLSLYAQSGIPRVLDRRSAAPSHHLPRPARRLLHRPCAEDRKVEVAHGVRDRTGFGRAVDGRGTRVRYGRTVAQTPTNRGKRKSEPRFLRSPRLLARHM